MNYQDFPLTIKGDHILFNIDEYTLLLDTGSPMTMHAPDIEQLNITICDFTITSDVNPSFDDFTSMSHMNYHILLGNDNLSHFRFKIHFNGDAPVITFQRSSQTCEMFDHMSSVDIVGSPIPKISVSLPQFDDAEYTVFVDTGAPISYMTSHIASQFNEIEGERRRDFSPMYGEWETGLYRILIKIADRTFSIRFGVLPKKLEKLMLKGTGTLGIIGADLFRAVDTIGFDLSNKQLFVGSDLNSN
eukprot:TRINITY_DN5559_c0_g1_i1.p1 TRINITY_DN5559_c0_g1~~TRINITY_DN5559_c0_g1_i1.p1  ORF type:complete len:245 (-),score=35.11 TRINITY_DN5559_c0_g1_i1:251-985(-)